MAEAITRYRAMVPESVQVSNPLQAETAFRFSSDSSFDWVVLVLLPVILVAWLALALLHAVYFRHRVHILFLQVTLALPVVMATSWVSYFIPRASPWLNIGARLCEAWIVTSFGGLLFALARFQGADPYTIIASDKHARHFISLGTIGLSAGPEQTPSETLFWIKLMVFQFALVAPLCGLLQAILMYLGDDAEMTQMLFSVARAVSMVIALKVSGKLIKHFQSKV